MHYVVVGHVSEICRGGLKPALDARSAIQLQNPSRVGLQRALHDIARSYQGGIRQIQEIE